MTSSVGLCAACRHHREIRNRRGSRFHLCGRARTDPRFRKYPRLPVLECPGYEPGKSTSSPPFDEETP